MPGSEGPRVLITGDAIAGLIRAIEQMSSADLGPYAIVGGVAVAARLGRAHRVTRDVDTVVDQDHLSAAIALLRGLPTATADPAGGPHRILLEGTKVEVMEVGLMPDADDLGDLPERQRLFVSSHCWALTTATGAVAVLHALLAIFFAAAVLGEISLQVFDRFPSRLRDAVAAMVPFLRHRR